MPEALKDALIHARQTDKRGETAVQLMAPLNREAEARGLAVHWWNIQSDCHIPVVAKPEVLERWRGVRFDKKHPVLP